MNPKIFRCRSCGAKVSWNAASCPVCNRLVSNDRSKRYIIIGSITGLVLLAIIIVSFVIINCQK
jgi:ribosomal protein L40E